MREQDAPLLPHQAELFDAVKASMAHSSFVSNRDKLKEIAQQYAEDTGIQDGALTDEVFREACREYSVGRVLALNQLRQRLLTDVEMRQGGIEMFDSGKAYTGRLNYFSVYKYMSETKARGMVDKWRTGMGVKVNCTARSVVAKSIGTTGAAGDR